MSWDSYIDNLIGHSGDAQGEKSVESACIIGLDGSKWTTDSHANSLKITPQEAQKLGAVMKSGDMSDFQANGIYIAGMKYQFLREMDEMVIGKKKDHGSVTLGKTKSAIVIGKCKEGGSAGLVNKAVGVISEYLVSLAM